METKLRNLSTRKKPAHRVANSDGHDYVLINGTLNRYCTGSWWRLPKDEIVPVRGVDILLRVFQQIMA